MPLFEIVSMSAIVIVIFGAAMAWAGYNMGYCQGKTDEKEKQIEEAEE